MTAVSAPHRPAVPVENVRVSAYRVPTDGPEADGTLRWDTTTVVVVEITAGDEVGIGYTYCDAAAAQLVAGTLAGVLRDADALAVGAVHVAMLRALRNSGQPGIGSAAVSAVDVALWDLLGRLTGTPLATLLGRVRDAVPAYGSGGFTTYDDRRLRDQLADWARRGFRQVKMKVGSDPEDDLRRVELARGAIGPDVELYVDANGAYERTQALSFAQRFARFGVTWLEEPVSSDDLEGLRFLRDRAPAGMVIAAGEYGYRPVDFRRLLDAGAVDVLQADATRCGGVTGFRAAAALAEAAGVPLSCHTAPALHVHLACAVPSVAPLEYFHDHVRIESMLFDGVPEPKEGMLAPALDRPGHGLELRREEAQSYAL